jgi:hypothetical protein
MCYGDFILNVFNACHKQYVVSSVRTDCDIEGIWVLEDHILARLRNNYYRYLVVLLVDVLGTVLSNYLC